MNPKEPDKNIYTTFKIPLHKILLNSDHKEILFEAVDRVNTLTIHLYHMLRLWCLTRYHNGQQMIITTDLVRMAYRSLSKTKGGGRPPNKDNKGSLEEFEKFYRDTYRDLGYDTQVNGDRLSNILQSMSTSIVTCIENNIKGHFIAYLNRYVNSTFINSDQPSEQLKELRKELRLVKQDFLENTTTCNPKYHQWLNDSRDKVLPLLSCKNYYQQLRVDPQSFLPSMFYMNLQLESQGGKMFQPFPLRTESCPKYMPLDSRSLVDLLVERGEKSKLRATGEASKTVWGQYFDLNHPIFTCKRYKFDYRIQTDGVGASLQFIANEQVAVKQAVTDKKRAGRRRVETGITDKRQSKGQVIEQLRKNAQQMGDRQPEKQVKRDKKPSVKGEFNYIEELSTDELRIACRRGFLVADPGHHNLLYLLNESGDRSLRFTNRQRLAETGYYERRHKLDRVEAKLNVSEAKRELSEICGKSCDLERFKEYIKVKNRYNDQVHAAYKEEVFRWHRWRGYFTRERYYNGLINRIVKEYGPKRPIFYGDYSAARHLKGLVASPGIGLKRRIAEHLQVYNLDEFRTSCLSFLREERCEGLAVTREGEKRRLRSILRYSTQNGRHGSIGRDLNAVRNMCKLVHGHLQTGERLFNFCRSNEEPKPLVKGEYWAHVVSSRDKRPYRRGLKRWRTIAEGDSAQLRLQGNPLHGINSSEYLELLIME